ncbi:unnamed protein product, partial [Cuscuta europaea]
MNKVGKSQEPKELWLIQTRNSVAMFQKFGRTANQNLRLRRCLSSTCCSKRFGTRLLALCCQPSTLDSPNSAARIDPPPLTLAAFFILPGLQSRSLGPFCWSFFSCAHLDCFFFLFFSLLNFELLV